MGPDRLRKQKALRCVSRRCYRFACGILGLEAGEHVNKLRATVVEVEY